MTRTHVSPLYSTAPKPVLVGFDMRFLFTQTPDLELTPSQDNMCSFLTPGVSEVGKDSNAPRPSCFFFCMSGPARTSMARAAGYSHLVCRSHSADARMSHLRIVPLLLLYTRCCSGGGGTRPP